MTTTPAVRYERRGYIGLVTLSRPDNRNSMTPELLDAFADAVAQAKADIAPGADPSGGIRCVVITGEGRCFSAGADFKSNIQIEGPGGFTPPHERSYAMYRPFLSVLDLSVPVVGALQGHAVGGGFGLSLVTDIRVVSEGAKYGANFAKLGLHPGMAVSWLLPRIVGVQRAAELLFTGRLFLGKEGADIGYAVEAVPGDAVFERAWAIAEDIAANAPLAVQMMKRTFYEGLGWDPKQAAWVEAWAQAVTVDTEDAKEGMKALMEKRPPVFRGR